MTKSTKDRVKRRDLNRKLKSAEKALKIAEHRIEAKKVEFKGQK